MEHLPPVVSPYEPISVPFIAEEYDGGDFTEYPSRRGLNLHRLTQGDFQNLSPDQVASFLQTWLYFGLLRGILGVSIKTEDFVRVDEAGKKWLKTDVYWLSAQRRDDLNSRYAKSELGGLKQSERFKSKDKSNSR